MLILARDGIFPITKDATGNLLPHLPASGFNFPGTVQGEGKLNGVPSLFVRLAGCNLHCRWTTDAGNSSACDTAHAAYSIEGATRVSVDEIYNTIRCNTGHINHIVITGGEPFLQANALIRLCRKLKKNPVYHITVETNATLFNGVLADDIDFFSLSPKLASSVPPAPDGLQHDRLRINIQKIQYFIDHARNFRKDFQLKFVYASEKDISEIKSILSQLNDWKNEDILLMPLGANATELQENTLQTLKHCIQNGWRYCDRLHISLFGAKHGV